MPIIIIEHVAPCGVPQSFNHRGGVCLIILLISYISGCVLLVLFLFLFLGVYQVFNIQKKSLVFSKFKEMANSDL